MRQRQKGLGHLTCQKDLRKKGTGRKVCGSKAVSKTQPEFEAEAFVSPREGAPMDYFWFIIWVLPSSDLFLQLEYSFSNLKSKSSVAPYYLASEKYRMGP